MFLQHSKFISVLDFCSWWSLCLKGSVFLFYTSCCFSLFKCHFFWDGGFSLTTVKPIQSVSYLIILWYDSSEPFSIYIILFYLIVYCFITQSRMQDFWEPRPCMVCSTPRPCMACSKYLKPWLAHSSALNNFQRYDSSFLSFIGDKSKAQGGVRAEILTQCCALKTYTAMPPFAQLKVGNIKWRKGPVLSSQNFLWVPGLVVIVSTASSVKSWSWSLYILVSLVYFLFPFLFDLEPKIHMINILWEYIWSYTAWEKQTLDFKKAPKGLEFVIWNPEPPGLGSSFLYACCFLSICYLTMAFITFIAFFLWVYVNNTDNALLVLVTCWLE